MIATFRGDHDPVTEPGGQFARPGAGGQDDSGGLYVEKGFKRSYIVPGASDAQAREILAAITGKFPGFPIDDKTWASLIWGDESVLMDLGLDESDQGEDSHSKS